MNKWKNIDSDGLPPNGLAVLVCLRPSKVVTIGYRYEKKGKKFWQLYGPIADITDLSNEEVSDWQPLPTPSKV